MDSHHYPDPGRQRERKDSGNRGNKHGSGPTGSDSPGQGSRGKEITGKQVIIKFTDCMMELAEHIGLEELEAHLSQPLSMTPSRMEKVNRNRQYLEERISREEVHYGINTGFGSL